MLAGVTPLAIAVTDKVGSSPGRCRRRDRLHLAGGVARQRAFVPRTRLCTRDRYHRARRTATRRDRADRQGHSDRDGAEHEPGRQPAVQARRAGCARARRKLRCRDLSRRITATRSTHRVARRWVSAVRWRRAGAWNSRTSPISRVTARPGIRKRGHIGFSVLRGGDIVGDHRLIFAGAGEQIELAHHAQDRSGFARGALVAARWVVGRPPGLYSMLDVLGL